MHADVFAAGYGHPAADAVLQHRIGLGRAFAEHLPMFAPAMLRLSLLLRMAFLLYIAFLL